MPPASPAARHLLPLLAALALTCAAPAAAQEIRGRVVEAGTQRGVDGVVVHLIDAGETPVARARTDRAGVYLLRAPGPGVYRVRAERLGYRAARSEAVDLAAGATTQLLLPLAAEAVEVAAMTVTAQREDRPASLVSRGFFERREAGFGHFVERDEIERRNPLYVSQVLAGVAGLRLARVGDGGLYDARFGRGEQECMPTVFIDGMRIRQGGRSATGATSAVPIDGLVDPKKVEAIEVYRGPAETPPQFGGTTSRCGVIVIWTAQR